MGVALLVRARAAGFVLETALRCALAALVLSLPAPVLEAVPGWCRQCRKCGYAIDIREHQPNPPDHCPRCGAQPVRIGPAGDVENWDWTVACKQPPRPAAPEGVTIEGRVTAPDGARPGLPLVGVAVRVMQGEREIARAVSAGNGAYRVSVPAGQKVALRVELQRIAEGRVLFAVVHDEESEPLWMRTAEFAVAAPKDAGGRALPMRVDVSFAPGPRIDADPRHTDDLADLGFAYVATHKAWTEATTNLGATLDLALPLEVRVSSSGSVGAPVPMTTGDGTDDPCIRLPPEYSRRAQRLREGVVWHEFGHYVMADTFSNLYPRDPAGEFHGGYRNPSTTDSWTEGFASFFALLVNLHQNGQQRPVIEVNGWPLDFGLAWYMPWSQDDGISLEEVAVATLLWDLMDAEENETSLAASNQFLREQGVRLPELLTDEKPPVTYRDRVSLGARDLFAILAGTDAAGERPAAASEGYPHVFDVYQLHAALVARDVGSHRREGAALSELDELFVAHGFFADVSPQNLFWDAGETVGLTANGGALRAGPMEVPARPERRYTPLLPNSHLRYVAQDDEGQPLALRRFAVEARFAPPHERHDFRTEVEAAEPGRLYVVCPNPAIVVTYTLRPLVAGEPAGDALEIPCDAYWEAKRRGARGHFLEHRFRLGSRPAAPPAAPPAAEPDEGGPDLQFLAALAFGATCLAGGLGMFVVAFLVGRSARTSRAPAAIRRTPSRLLVSRPDGSWSEVPLVAGRSLALGRTADNDIVLPETTASSHHARLWVLAGGRVPLKDLGSRNGVRVNGRLVLATDLHVGDEVWIGESSIRVD